MKKLCFSILLSMVTLVFTFADSPVNVQAALKKMYPNAVDVDWSQKGIFYVADFMMNGFEKDVWFDIDAKWIMTQTNLETLDRLSPAIYNAFVLGQYASWTIDDVILTEFPGRPEIVVIKVGQDNMDVEYQLFYSTNGSLLCTRDVSNMDDTLWPGTFDCNL